MVLSKLCVLFIVFSCLLASLFAGLFGWKFMESKKLKTTLDTKTCEKCQECVPNMDQCKTLINVNAEESGKQINWENLLSGVQIGGIREGFEDVSLPNQMPASETEEIKRIQKILVSVFIKVRSKYCQKTFEEEVNKLTEGIKQIDGSGEEARITAEITNEIERQKKRLQHIRNGNLEKNYAIYSVMEQGLEHKVALIFKGTPNGSIKCKFIKLDGTNTGEIYDKELEIFGNKIYDGSTEVMEFKDNCTRQLSNYGRDSNFVVANSNINKHSPLAGILYAQCIKILSNGGEMIVDPENVIFKPFADDAERNPNRVFADNQERTSTGILTHIDPTPINNAVEAWTPSEGNHQPLKLIFEKIDDKMARIDAAIGKGVCGIAEFILLEELEYGPIYLYSLVQNNNIEMIEKTLLGDFSELEKKGQPVEESYKQFITTELGPYQNEIRAFRPALIALAKKIISSNCKDGKIRWRKIADNIKRLHQSICGGTYDSYVYHPVSLQGKILDDLIKD